MNTLYFDFETRGPDIKAHGGARHLSAPWSGINCMSFAINDGPTDVIKYHDCTPAKLRPILAYMISNADRVVAHGALFELFVLMFRLELPVDLTKWVDTMAKCAYHGYPRDLDKAAKALKCTQLKDIAGKAAMLEAASGKWTPESNPAVFDRLYVYGAKDIAPMRELDQKLPDLPDQVRQQWALDTEINLRGVPVDVKALENAVSLVADLKILNNANMHRITGGAVEAVTQPERLVRWVNGQGVSMVDCTADTVDRLLGSGCLPGAVRAALQLRQSTGLSSLSKYQKMLDYQVNGRLYGMFVWYGAHTGRPTGTGPQVLNPPRGEDPVKWAALLSEYPEAFKFISRPDERLKEAIRGVISVA